MKRVVVEGYPGDDICVVVTGTRKQVCQLCRNPRNIDYYSSFVAEVLLMKRHCMKVNYVKYSSFNLHRNIRQVKEGKN